MRKRLQDKERLLHIIEAIENIFEFTKGKSFEEFEKDKMLRFAVFKNLEIIGEAAFFLTKEFKEKTTHIEWKDIIGLRHVLVHGYYQIRNEIIWATIERDLKPLKQKLEELVN